MFAHLEVVIYSAPVQESQIVDKVPLLQASGILSFKIWYICGDMVTESIWDTIHNTIAFIIWLCKPET